MAARISCRSVTRFASAVTAVRRPQLAASQQLALLAQSFYSTMSLHFSQGEDESRLTGEVDGLLQNEWRVDHQAEGLEKTYYFKNFTKTMDFVNLVGIRCKSANHHPVMTVEYGSVHLHWTTHNPKGLSSKDTLMARYCDDQAQTLGAVDRGEGAKCR